MSNQQFAPQPGQYAPQPQQQFAPQQQYGAPAAAQATAPAGAQTNEARIVIGPARASFVYLVNPDEKGKYRLELLVPKSRTDLVQQLQHAQSIAIQQGMQKTFAGRTDIAVAIKDCDFEYQQSVAKKHQFAQQSGIPADIKPQRPETVGMLRLNAKANDQPTFMDGVPANRFYSGCIVGASILFWPYGAKDGGSPGVTVILNAVKFLQDGEPLTSTPDYETQFEEMQFNMQGFPAPAPGQFAMVPPATGAPYAAPSQQGQPGQAAPQWGGQPAQPPVQAPPAAYPPQPGQAPGFAPQQPGQIPYNPAAQPAYAPQPGQPAYAPQPGQPAANPYAAPPQQGQPQPGAFPPPAGAPYQ